MSISRYQSWVPESADEGRLDHYTADWLTQALRVRVSRSDTRKMILAGAVYLDGIRTRIPSATIKKGSRIDAYVDRARIARFAPTPALATSPTGATDAATGAARAAVETKLEILYENEDLIAVNKPAGLPTQPTLDEARDNLFERLKRERRGGTASGDGHGEGGAGGGAAAYLGLHHRLDRDTSGVVVFTKRESANAELARVFKDRLASKVYWAITAPDQASREGRAWTVRNFLGRDPESRSKRARYIAVRAGGDLAETDFKVLRKHPSSGALLVEARPRTGRTHQIRTHLGLASGLPILGDALYGYRGPPVPRTLLHAKSIEFPFGGRRIRIEAPVPPDFSPYL